MTMDRFHKAARDGILDILKEATKRDSNSKDEDGMTPTLWAAFEGNLDALRLLVGRGGDPNKSDHFGNTALHFSAARGHMNCVTFLANFGVNPWALDIDYHTPKELAAMNNRDEILRFLDGVIAKEEATNKKTVKAMKEKAKKDAEKRIKEFQKLQKKAEKAAAEEQKKLLKEREKMEKYNDMIVGHDGIMPHRPSTVLINIRKDNRKKQSPKYSEIVSNGTSSSGKKVTGAVYKKAQQKKFQKDNGSSKSEFKVGKVDSDGKRSISSLSGLRRDSEVMYVGKRGKISDVFETKNDKNSRSLSEPDIFHNADSGFGDDVLLHEPSSIFDRPGFGSVAFRNSITATLSALPSRKADDRDSAHASDKGSDPRSGMDDSIGSAGSLAQRNRNMPWDEEDIISDDDDDDDAEWSPLQLFLLSFGLGDYVQQFIDEQIDLEALMLLTEDDLKGLGLPTGPRKKLLKAIEDRKAALEDPGEVADSRL